jgi:hypothetical protein
MEYLRERRSALENAGISQFGCAENPAQQPADPKILLDDHRIDAARLLILPKEQAAFVGWKGGECAHA